MKKKIVFVVTSFVFQVVVRVARHFHISYLGVCAIVFEPDKQKKMLKNKLTFKKTDY